MASPILPCGCLCTIPIPYRRSGVGYSKIQFGKRSLEQICGGFPGWRKNALAHLDPDLRFESLSKRPRGWRPAFGQSSAAASHLAKQFVDKGDLFIFFGWFRETEVVDGKLQFRRSDKHGRHIIYGWLKVEEVFPVDGRELPDHLQFLSEHAHIRLKEHPNRIYISSKSGAGLFAKAYDDLVLTKPGCNRSQWILPPVFKSVYQQPDLTYHRNKEKRWQELDGQICLKTVGRGQEFVLDCAKHPEVLEHYLNLIESTPKAPVRCSHKEVEDLFWD